MDEAKFYNRLVNSAPAESAFVLPDHGLIHQELRHKGMTLMLLWEDTHGSVGEGAGPLISDFDGKGIEGRGILLRISKARISGG